MSATKLNLKIINVPSNVGNYAMSTLDESIWTSDTNKIQTKIQKTKEAVHQIFLDCLPFISDAFWYDKFIAASNNKFPKGFSYSNNILSFTKNIKCISIQIPANPIEAAYTTLEFFRKNGNIYSNTDEELASEYQNIMCKNSENQIQLTWGDMSSKVKECMIYNFLGDMRRNMELSIEEKDNLKYIILKGIHEKLFGKHNIEVEDNRIKKIGGLLWNNIDRFFYIDVSLTPVGTKSKSKNNNETILKSEKDTVPLFYTKWCKYLDGLENNANKYNRTSSFTIHHPTVVTGTRLVLVNSTSTNLSTIKESKESID